MKLFNAPLTLNMELHVTLRVLLSYTFCPGSLGLVVSDRSVHSDTDFDFVHYNVRTCSESEEWYRLEMCFLMVSLTDLTFLPKEIRGVGGHFMASLMTPSLCLF